MTFETTNSDRNTTRLLTCAVPRLGRKRRRTFSAGNGRWPRRLTCRPTDCPRAVISRLLAIQDRFVC